MFETKRLHLIPLTEEGMRLWMQNIQTLERTLGCSYQGNPMEGALPEAIKAQMAAAKKDKNNILYHTFWLMVLKEEQIIVGAACFKGAPNAEGQVEIGYGINQSFQNQGYTTEAVNHMIDWAFSQPNIKEVTAETDKDNVASHKILQKNGMTLIKETSNGYWWSKKAVSQKT